MFEKKKQKKNKTCICRKDTFIYNSFVIQISILDFVIVFLETEGNLLTFICLKKPSVILTYFTFHLEQQVKCYRCVYQEMLARYTFYKQSHRY